MKEWVFQIGEIFRNFGTKWDTTRFRRDSTNSPYGQFDVIPGVSNFEFYKLHGLTDSAGEFEIFPTGDSKCKVKLNDDACIAPDTTTKRYNMNSERWIYSKLKRDNLFISFDYDLNEDLSFFQTFFIINLTQLRITLHQQLFLHLD